MINLLPLAQDEQITAVQTVEKASESKYLVMLTEKGWIKKTELSQFENVRRNGLIAIGLEEGDKLKWVLPCSTGDDVFIGTSGGMAIRFNSDKDLRPLGRTARGVTAIRLRPNHTIVDFSVISQQDNVPSEQGGSTLFLLTNDGFGKRMDLGEFRDQARGGIGLICTKFKNAKSRVKSTCVVRDDDELMIASANGVVVRMRAGDIPKQGRMATGVRIQAIGEDDEIATVSRVVAGLNDDPDIATETTPTDEDTL
jgi:DNA gyrase subunit A